MIETHGFSYKKIIFPCGEPHITIRFEPDHQCSPSIPKIIFNFEYSDEIIDLILICNALNNHGRPLPKILHTLLIPYIPFSRQDRICNKGEAFSLKVFANIINSLNIYEIITYDPHSEVSNVLINNLQIVEQHEIFKGIFSDKSNFYLISPDGGALKKIYKLAQIVDCIDVIECSKQRNIKNGEITGVKVHCDNLHGKDCYIIDDICDGGRTFIEIAKILKTKNAGKIILCVSHGFFTKGLSVFNDLIDKIYTSKGKVK